MLRPKKRMITPSKILALRTNVYKPCCFLLTVVSTKLEIKENTSEITKFQYILARQFYLIDNKNVEILTM